MGNKNQGSSAVYLEAPKVLGLGKAGCRAVEQQAVSFEQGEIIFIVIKWQR